MKLKLTNKTGDPQQIMLCVGEGLVVYPGEEKIIDLNSVYAEEIQRLDRFFKIENVEEVQPKKSYKSFEPEVKVVKEEGGNE